MQRQGIVSMYKDYACYAQRIGRDALMQEVTPTKKSLCKISELYVSIH